MKVTIYRTQHDEYNRKEFCSITLEDERGYFSVTGTHGYVLTPKEAEKTALAFWISFFEEMPEERKIMNRRQGTSFRSAKAAAQYVLSIDGKFHGLDVVQKTESEVFVGDSFGQIREDLTKFFPDFVWLFEYHLSKKYPKKVHYFLDKLEKEQQL